MIIFNRQQLVGVEQSVISHFNVILFILSLWNFHDRNYKTW